MMVPLEEQATLVWVNTDLDEPRFLVELVLDLAPFRDLHDLSQRSQPYIHFFKSHGTSMPGMYYKIKKVKK